MPGRVAGFRAYINNGQDGNSHAVLWNGNTFELLAAARFRIRATTGNQWHQAWFRPWVRINTSDFFNFAVLYPVGQKFQTTNALTSTVNHNGIEFNNGFTSTNASVYTATLTLNANAQAVDLLFVPD